MYPDITSKHFQEEIARIAEFRFLENDDGLYESQEFVRRFMGPRSPYQGILLFHKLGSGKSISCIAVAVDHYLYDGKSCLILTKGTSGSENFLDRIHQFSTMTSTRFRDKPEALANIFQRDHYMSMANHIAKLTDKEVKRSFSNRIIVLDEFHNVRRDSNSDESLLVYDSIYRMILLSENRKVIVTTGTPMTDNAEQLKPILKIIWESYPRSLQPGVGCSLDDMMYGIVSFNQKVISEPDTIEKGVDLPGFRFSRKVHIVTMSGIQLKSFQARRNEKISDIYRSLDQTSLFVDHLGRYGQGLHDKKASDPMFEEISKTYTIVTSHQRTRNVKTKYIRFRPEKRHFANPDFLRDLSCKYTDLVRSLEDSEGLSFVFVEEVLGSGLLILCAILSENGYDLYTGDSIDLIDKRKRYAFCTGDSSYSPWKDEVLDGFSDERNRYGDYVKVLIGSRVIGESISLRNVRHFHGLIPHWNHSVMEQAIGRAVRSTSHDDLLEHERYVNVKVYAAVTPDSSGGSEYDISDNKEVVRYGSTDLFKIFLSEEKQKKINENELMMQEHCVEKKILYNPELSPYESDGPKSLDYRTFISNRLDRLVRNVSVELANVLNSVRVGKGKKDLSLGDPIGISLLCRSIARSFQERDTVRYRGENGVLSPAAWSPLCVPEVIRHCVRNIIFECTPLRLDRFSKECYAKCFNGYLYLTQDPFAACESPGDIIPMKFLEGEKYRVVCTSLFLTKSVSIETHHSLIDCREVVPIKVYTLKEITKLIFLQSSSKGNSGLRSVWSPDMLACQLEFHIQKFCEESLYQSLLVFDIIRCFFQVNGQTFWYKLNGRQRVFCDGFWQDDVNRRLMLSPADRAYDIRSEMITGMLSLKDKRVRISVPELSRKVRVATQRGSRDKRTEMRGRCVHTIKKSLLALLNVYAVSVTNNNPDEMTMISFLLGGGSRERSDRYLPEHLATRFRVYESMNIAELSQKLCENLILARRFIICP